MIEEIIFLIFVLLFSVILHECAHGWMALLCGDPTAKNLGRLTLNPIKHIDPFGTLILPGGLLLLRLFGYHFPVFGWAKPVPVLFNQLRHPKRDMMLVAIVGPLTNILIAVILSQVLQIFQLQLSLKYFDFIVSAIFINLLLAVFNMIPVPPLDGSRIVSGILPNSLAKTYNQLEPYGILVVVALSYVGFFNWFVIPSVEYLGNLLGVNFK